MRKILITCLFFVPLISMAASSYQMNWVNHITPGSNISIGKISDQCIQSIEPADFTDLEYKEFISMNLIDKNIGHNCTDMEKYQSWSIWDTGTGKPLVGEVKFRHWNTSSTGLPASWRTSIDVPQWDYTKIQVNALCVNDSGVAFNCINSADGIKDVIAVCIVLTQRGHRIGLVDAFRCGLQ